MSKTRDLYEAQSKLRDEMQFEFARTARKEFPVGTKVQWHHGYRNGKRTCLSGVVHDVSASYHCTVKTPSGAAHRVDWEKLEAIP